MADFEVYEKGGKKYERVTTVLDYLAVPELVNWKVRVGKAKAGQISRQALKVGSRVDELVEADAFGGGYTLKKTDSAEVISAMKAWERWKADYPDEFGAIIGTQETVYSDAWGVAGTMDLHMVNAVTDIKTSKRVSLKYWVQMAFYNHQLRLPAMNALMLDKELGEYRYVACPYPLEYLEQILIGHINLYKYYKGESL